MSDIAEQKLIVDELKQLVLEIGFVGVQTMALLDKANTESFGMPEMTQVNWGKKQPRYSY